MQRHGDTWELSTGAPLPIKNFLPAGAKPRRDLPREAMRQAQSQLAAGTSLYVQHYETALKRHWSPSRFYIQDRQLVFFYPLYSVAPYVEGIPTFRVPLQTDENTEKKMG